MRRGSRTETSREWNLVMYIKCTRKNKQKMWEEINSTNEHETWPEELDIVRAAASPPDQKRSEKERN